MPLRRELLMPDLKPESVIAEHAYSLEYGQVCCSCGWESEDDDPSAHAAHVVERLSAAGYTIVPTRGGVYGACGERGCLECLPLFDSDNQPLAAASSTAQEKP